MSILWQSSDNEMRNLYWKHDHVCLLYILLTAIYHNNHCFIVALYGAFFSDNTAPAFANNLLWWCLGLAVGSGYSNALCTGTKIAILFGMLIIGMTGYLIAELVDRKEKKTKKRQVVEGDVGNDIAMQESDKGDVEPAVTRDP